MPSCPSLILASVSARKAGFSRKCFVIGGPIELTRMPRNPSFTAIALTRPSTACFDAQYTARFAAPT